MLKQFDSADAINLHLDSVTTGSFLVDDIKVIGNYVKKLKSGDKFLEIGTSRGKSIGAAIYQAKDGVRFYTCDIIDEQAYGQVASRVDFFEAEGFNKVCTFILKNSIDLAKEWNKGKLDMIFIDGDHSYESVKSDILAWTPHLKRGGYMFFHDYSDSQFTASVAIDECVRDSDKFKEFYIAQKDGLRSSMAGAKKI